MVMETNKVEDPQEGSDTARRMVIAHGKAATCWQSLHPQLCRWYSSSGDALVGYVINRGVRVAAGEPICPIERMAEVCREFEREAARNGEKVCYLAAEPRMIRALERAGAPHSVLNIGAQPEWKPGSLLNRFRTSSSLRYQVSRARHKGLVVSEWNAQSPAKQSLAVCLDEWIAAKSLPPMGFMTDPHLLDRLTDRRVVVATVAGAVTGYAVMTPVPARNGWLIEQIVRCGMAPNGISESLVAGAAQSAASSGDTFITLGASPLSRRVPSGSMPFWLALLIWWMRAHGTRFYNFRGLDAFKAKFHPDQWVPVYLAAAEPKITLPTLYAVLGAFTLDSPVKVIGKVFFDAALSEVKSALKGKSRPNAPKSP
jgi:phosphatidylglycerol lysyltransferase